ncbi:unnamed protein product, partial [Ectocarpus sp. 8 AP-2014]
GPNKTRKGGESYFETVHCNKKRQQRTVKDGISRRPIAKTKNRKITIRNDTSSRSIATTRTKKRSVRVISRLTIAPHELITERHSGQTNQGQNKKEDRKNGRPESFPVWRTTDTR